MKKWKGLFLLLPFLVGCNARENQADERAGECLEELLVEEKGEVSVEIFNSLRAGMNISQVHQIIGFDPSLNQSLPSLDSESMYQRWDGRQGSIHVGFTDGYVDYFAYFGQERMLNLSVEDLELLGFEMSIAEMEAVMGAAPSVKSASSSFDWVSLQLEWHDENSNTIIVAFFDDEPPFLAFEGTGTIRNLGLNAFTRITDGMSKDEVLLLMDAAPTTKQKNISFSGAVRSTMSWRTRNSETLSVYFIDEIVTSTSQFNNESS